jgi:uncharacterized protein
MRSPDRMVSLDVFRGFALWGILLVNIIFFSLPMYGDILQIDWTKTSYDNIAETGVDWFVQGKFYTLFSLLFGVGFVIFITRARTKERTPNRLFLRRVLILLCVGIGNALLLWWGDILIVYALNGLLLLLFYRRSARTLLLWAIAINVSFGAISFVGTLSNPDPNPQKTAQIAKQNSETKQRYDTAFAQYSTGTFRDVVVQQTKDWGFYASTNMLLSLFLVLPLFLLGASVYKSGILLRLHDDHAFRRKWLVYSLVTGVVFTIIKEYCRNHLTSYTTLMSSGPTLYDAGFYYFGFFADLGLACFYALTLLTLLQSPSFSKWVLPLQYAGRMALTNYLVQSVICGILFYGYGFGLYGKVNAAGLIGIATGIFIVQVVYSRWWLLRFSMGPMESVWRALTYGKRKSHA